MSATLELASFRRFIVGTIQHLVDSLESLGEEQLNWRADAADTNSVYAIAMHVLGNAEDNILGTLCGLPVHRVRDEELAARGRTWEAVRDRWQALQARIEAALASLPAGALDGERRHPRRGVLTGREVLLVVTRHAAEHWGEAQLTLNLLKARSRSRGRAGAG